MRILVCITWKTWVYFPLSRGKESLRRAGHTEPHRFPRLTLIKTPGVIVEILNEDGSMAEHLNSLNFPKNLILNL